MNKDTIIKYINEYNLDKTKFVVISGAALVLLGVSETTNDIDICCEQDYVNYLLKNYNCQYKKINILGEKVYNLDNIFDFGVSFFPLKVEIVDNEIRCSSIKDILKLKKFLNREKDRKIIKKLEKMLNDK